MYILPYLQLVRLENLFGIFLIQVLIKYFLFEPFGIATSLSDVEFGLLVFSMMSLAAAGTIIADLHNTDSDAINKPQQVLIGKVVSEKAAMNLFYALTILGVGIGFYLANEVGYPIFTSIFILASVLLYLCATQLKQFVLIGNLSISFLVGMLLLVIGIFELLPAITPENRNTQRVIFSILVDYAIFAFLIQLLLEIVKDQEHIKGDHNAGINTLPVLLGRKRCNKIIFIVALIPIAGVIYYIYSYLFENLYAVVYVLLFILGPLLIFWTKTMSARSQKEFRLLGRLLKFILAAGLLSIGLYQFILL